MSVRLAANAPLALMSWLTCVALQMSHAWLFACEHAPAPSERASIRATRDGYGVSAFAVHSSAGAYEAVKRRAPISECMRL